MIGTHLPQHDFSHWQGLHVQLQDLFSAQPHFWLHLQVFSFSFFGQGHWACEFAREDIGHTAIVMIGVVVRLVATAALYIIFGTLGLSNFMTKCAIFAANHSGAFCVRLITHAD